ncbi:MAG TPA: type IV pilus biogenesis/stability protein PilW [Rhodocyclaceae bacterium]|nr:type IV pilus biogenesis/stability protein PilW [Rhodocyclaceae bacterium]
MKNFFLGLMIVCGVISLTGCVTSVTQSDGQSGRTGSQNFSGDVSNGTRAESDEPTKSDARTKSKAHVDLGNAYLEAARMGVALDEANLAIGYDHTYAPAYMLLGLVYANLDQNDQAETAFAEASRLAPGDPEVNNNYGWFLCSRGREQEGLKHIEQAATNPYYNTPARAYTNAGLCYLRIKNDASAEAQFARAYQFDPTNKQVLFQLAAISYRKGDEVRARTFLSTLQGLMVAPTSETLWLGLCIEHKLGNKEKENDYAFRLRRDFASSAEYQALLQGKYE